MENNLFCFEISDLLFENKINVPDCFYITVMDILKKQYHIGYCETELFNYIQSQEDKLDPSLLISIYNILLKGIKNPLKQNKIQNDLKTELLLLFLVLFSFESYILFAKLV